MSKKAVESKGEAEFSFDERLERLEGIVAELEGGGLGLEESIARYQEGIAHVKGCHTTLASYRKQVEELSKEADATLRPFDEDPDLGSD